MTMIASAGYVAMNWKIDRRQTNTGTDKHSTDDVATRENRSPIMMAARVVLGVWLNLT